MNLQVIKFLPLICLALNGLAPGQGLAEEKASVKAVLNGLEVTVDRATGCIMELSYPGPGVLLRAAPERRSIVDMAYPYKGLELLRLTARTAPSVRIEQTSDSLTIHWDRLGLNRPKFEVPGRVAATVRMQATPDGQSILMTCSVDNQSTATVQQVLFPDFSGLLPFAGPDKTDFRMTGLVQKPFVSLQTSNENAGFYGTPGNWAVYPFAFTRWMDVGSNQGGFSLFPKLWSWGPIVEGRPAPTSRVLLHLNEIDHKLRLMCEHQAQIAPGQQWTSLEYVLTPNKLGWGKRNEPFVNWVAQHNKRKYPLPKHVRDGLGFRTVWMTEQYEWDPEGKSINWKYKDLLPLAEESHAHGLDEMNLWQAGNFFTLPLTHNRKELGTLEEFKQAYREAKKIGVNMSIFVSLLTLYEPTASRFGLKVGPGNAWTYHTDMVPRFNPYYAKAFQGAGVNQHKQMYQDEVFAALKGLIDEGFTSISWDQVCPELPEPNIYTIFRKTRDYARKKDPQSAFSGESIVNLDEDSQLLDYTWTWANYDDNIDHRGLVSAYPFIRWNIGVNGSPKAVKSLFMDNIYLNVMPAKPEGINGSAWIKDFPELSRALKTCAARRRQFLPYFTQGRLVGDSLLSDSFAAPGRLNGYLMGHKALVIVLNRGAQPASFSIETDLAAWLNPKAKKFNIKTYDEEGKQVQMLSVDQGLWKTQTPSLPGLGLFFYEIEALP